MKGQVTAVTAILVTGLTIGAVASVYVWGSPVLEKRESTAAVDNIESQINGLYDEIINIRDDGEGTSTPYDFSLNDADVESIAVNEERDYINVTLASDQQSPYPSGRWSFIRGETLQNISIEEGADTGAYALADDDLPGVVMVQSTGGASSLITYRIEFRNMYTETPSGPVLRKVDLQAEGGTRASGDSTIRLTNNGVSVDDGAEALTLPSGEEINRERTVISIDLR